MSRRAETIRQVRRGEEKVKKVEEEEGGREGGRMSGEQRQEGTGYAVSLKSLRGSEDRERE